MRHAVREAMVDVVGPALGIRRKRTAPQGVGLSGAALEAAVDDLAKGLAQEGAKGLGDVKIESRVH